MSNKLREASSVNTKNLLDDNSVITFGNIDSYAKSRDTVVAVIFDRAKNEYLCQYWEDYNGLTCLLSGGIEEGEDSYQALQREIAEETGYTDFQVIGRLGGNVKSYYIKGTTKESLVKNIIPYLVILNSSAQNSTTKEDDEKFENLLKTPEKILEMMEKYEQATGSTLADHKEILSRAIGYLKRF